MPDDWTRGGTLGASSAERHIGVTRSDLSGRVLAVRVVLSIINRATVANFSQDSTDRTTSPLHIQCLRRGFSLHLVGSRTLVAYSVGTCPLTCQPLCRLQIPVEIPKHC